MTTRTFRPYEPDDLWLLPPSPREWLPEGHLAEVVSDVVDALDLTAILTTYGGVTRGTAPYPPRMLVKVLFYAYAVGVPASRQIARELWKRTWPFGCWRRTSSRIFGRSATLASRIWRP